MLLPHLSSSSTATTSTTTTTFFLPLVLLLLFLQLLQQLLLPVCVLMCRCRALRYRNSLWQRSQLCPACASFTRREAAPAVCDPWVFSASSSEDSLLDDSLPDFFFLIRLLSSWLKVWYWGTPEDDPDGGGGTMVGRVGGLPCRALWKGVPDSAMVESPGIPDRGAEKLMADSGVGERGVRVEVEAERVVRVVVRSGVPAGEPVWQEDSTVRAFFFFLPDLAT